MSLFRVIVFLRMYVRDLAMCRHTIEMCFLPELGIFRAEYSDEPKLTYKKKVNGFLIKLNCMIPKQEM